MMVQINRANFLLERSHIRDLQAKAWIEDVNKVSYKIK